MPRFSFAGLFLLIAGAVIYLSPLASSQENPKLRQGIIRVLTSHDELKLDPRRVFEGVQRDGKFTLSTSRGSFELQLEPYDIRSPNYRAVMVDQVGLPSDLARTQLFTYRGRVVNRNGLTARFTIEHEKLEGVIISPDELLFLEPARHSTPSASSTDYVFYSSSDLPLEGFGECGITLSNEVRKESARIKANLRLSLASQALAPESFGPVLELELATESDFEYTTAFGSASAANNSILSIVNQVDGIFQAQLGIAIHVVFQRAWTANNDPYTLTEYGALIEELRTSYDGSFMPGQPPARDLVHFWTGKEVDGSIIGAAYPGVVCQNPAESYGFSQILDVGLERVVLTAHEIGHNFGARHVDERDGADCEVAIMNAFVTSSTNFCQFSRDEITSYTMDWNSCLTRLTSVGCTYSIAPEDQVLGSGATNSAINVTTSVANCPWALASERSWVSIGTGAGIGSGSATYSVQANNGGVRRARVDVAGRVLRITQAASPSCAVTPIGFGQTIPGNFAASDCRAWLPNRPSLVTDRYSFSANAGQRIAIDLTASTATGALLYLIAPDGHVIANATFETFVTTVLSSIPGQNTLFTLPSTGIYFIEATTFVENSTGPYSLTLFDDRDADKIFFESSSLQENEGAGSFVVNVIRGRGSSGAASVKYAVTPGTATASIDFLPTSGTLSFADTEVMKSFQFNIFDDSFDEPDETINLTLSDPTGTGGLGSPKTAVFTILDNDPPASLQVNDRVMLEGNSGNTTAVFTVSLTSPHATTVTVNAATVDGTAKAGQDFQSVSTALTFTPGQISKNVSVSIFGDTLYEENESFTVELRDAVGVPVSDQFGMGTIVNDETPPSLSIDDVVITETDSGTADANFTVTLSFASGATTTVVANTTNGTAAAPDDYSAVSSLLVFDPGQTTKMVTVPIVGDTRAEPSETFLVNLSGASNATISDGQGVGTINDTDPFPAIQFRSPGYSINEGVTVIPTEVTRSGDTSQSSSVDFATTDGAASSRSDYTAAFGTITFAPGETDKTIDILVSEDSFLEGSENFIITLSNPTGNHASLGSQISTSVSIIDGVSEPVANPNDDSTIFVGQHYHDFLNREPDAAGLAFWTNEIEQCDNDAACREIHRINVSAAFFLSIEFQETGYLVYRMYKSAFGDATSPNVPGTVPFVRLRDFLHDSQRISAGVIVGQGNWQQLLEGNKAAFALEYVQRPQFVLAFPSNMSADAFVTKLDQNAGGVLSDGEKALLVSELGLMPADVAKRASVIRKVAEDADLRRNELSRGFVLMQYFGYLRRNADESPDRDFRGWKFWLDKLNQFNGDFVQAEMVKAFITSGEYRHRFGP